MNSTNSLKRIVLLIAFLTLTACGGGGGGGGGASNSTCVWDSSAWDNCTWAP